MEIKGNSGKGNMMVIVKETRAISIILIHLIKLIQLHFL